MRFRNYLFASSLFLPSVVNADEISSLESAISSTKLQISQANASVDSLNSSIARTMNESSRFQSEALTFDRSARDYEAKHKSIQVQKKFLERELKSLELQIADLDRRLIVNDKLLDDLTTLEQELLDLIKIHNQIVSQVSVIESDLDAISNLQQDWARRSRQHLEQNGPIFSNVTNYQEFQNEYQKIMQAWSKFPPQSKILVAENTLVEKIELTLILSESMHKRLRHISASPAIGAFLYHIQNDQISDIFQSIDSFYSNQYYALTVTKGLLQKTQASRNTLRSSVVIAWLKQINLKLHSINVEDAAQIIADISQALNSAEAFADIKASLTQKETRVEELFRKMLPRLAHAESQAGLDYLNEASESLSKVNLSGPYKSQIEMLISSKLQIFQIKLNRANDVIANKSQEYMAERKRIIEALASRNPQLSEYCKSLMTTIRSSTVADLKSEEEFAAFRNNCN